MKIKHYRSICTALLPAAVLMTMPLSAQQAGEEWEYQGSMDMMGMQMPIPATKQCQSPEQGNTPPVENNCKFNDVRTEGDTTSFKIACGEPNPMEGSGTTTRTGDTLEVNYTMSAEGAVMSFAIKGKRLGSCPLKSP